MDMKISIIVPVFNLEHLLPKCIDSILDQSFKDFELILVNDGSTDKSDEICDQYANKDQRIKVIHKQNGGVSSARNAGLEAAKGKYIGFVDSDDYINKHMYEILYNKAIKYSSDIVICGYEEVYEGQYHTTDKLESNNVNKHFNNVDALKQMYLNKLLYITFVVPWNKLYKRSLFQDVKYKVRNIYDDETVIHKVLYNSTKITYTDSRLYYYTQRDGSQMNSSFHIKRFDKVYALKDREVFFRKRYEFDLHQLALKHYMDMFFWYYYLAKTNLDNIDSELKALKRTFDLSLIHLLKHKKISWKQKFMCTLFCMNPYLFEFVKYFKAKRNKT
jgi:glycosyltransferase involved in cell wall biosynthesis